MPSEMSAQCSRCTRTERSPARAPTTALSFRDDFGQRERRELREPRRFYNIKKENTQSLECSSFVKFGDPYGN